MRSWPLHPLLLLSALVNYLVLLPSVLLALSQQGVATCVVGCSSCLAETGHCTPASLQTHPASGTELLQRLAHAWGGSKDHDSHGHHAPGPLPMFTSCCPAWINLVEKVGGVGGGEGGLGGR